MLHYLIDDSFALVLGTFYVEHAGEGTFDPGDLFDPGYFREGRFRPPWYHQSTNSVTYTITLNGNETEVSGVWGTLEEWFLPPFTQESVDPDYVWVSNYYVYHVAGPAVVSGHVEVARIDNIWTYYNHSAPYLNVSVYITGQFVFRRLANRIYALSLIDAAPQYPVLRNLAVAGPNGSAISDGWEGDSAIHYATAHPVAGDMVTGANPLCFL
jgi:hypothetical protein